MAKEADYLERVYNVMTHDSLLFFTSHGRVLTIERAWDIPDAEPNSFGRPIVNFLQLFRKTLPFVSWYKEMLDLQRKAVMSQ